MINRRAEATDRATDMISANTEYLVQDNKDGVGETFLTYNLVVELIVPHPDQNVVVIGPCPQSNVSEIIPGGSGIGEENLNKLRGRNVTIVGYIKERLNKSPLSRLGNESSYFIQAHDTNARMPENLYILPGDADLDIRSHLIPHTDSSPIRKAWKKSRSLLVGLITSFETDKNISDRAKTFFIDRNPGFAGYTRLGMVAANRVIIFCTIDAASVRGVGDLVKLIYGVSIDKLEQDEIFLNFDKKVKQNPIESSELYPFVQSHSRANENNTAKAFRSRAEEVKRVTDDLLDAHPRLLTDVATFERIQNVKDSNALAVIISHEGYPLGRLQHKGYIIYGVAARTNKAQTKALEFNVSAVVKRL